MKKTIKRIIIFVLIAVVLLMALTGCNRTINVSQSNDDSLRKVLDKGQLILGLDMAFPPMGFVDENGEVVGFDIEVAQEVCNRLGVELVLQSIDWYEKENDLNDGKIDCIWNGLSITQSRSEEMCLSDPYMKNELIFMVPGNSELKGLRDLKGIKIGAQDGATALEVLEASDIYADIEVVKYNTTQEMMDQLKMGNLDAAFVDSVTAYYFIFSNEDTFYILPDSLGEEEYAVAFRKNDQNLRNKVQQLISDMKVDGTLGTISKKWFGSDITIVR